MSLLYRQVNPIAARWMVSASLSVRFPVSTGQPTPLLPGLRAGIRSHPLPLMLASQFRRTIYRSLASISF